MTRPKTSLPTPETALVLRSIRHGETSRIVTLFSLERGKFAAIAKGARSGKGNGAIGSLAAPSLIEAMVYHKSSRSVQLLAQASVIDPYVGLREDILKSAYGAAIVELLDRSMIEGDVNRAAFAAAGSALERLERSEITPRLAFQGFQLDLTAALGFALDATACPVCGTTPARTGWHNALMLSEGAICCEGCRIEGDAVTLTGESVNILRLLARRQTDLLKRLKTSEMAQNELSNALSRYIRHHHPALGSLPAQAMIDRLE
ncbi:MAG: DNA repair protein RecO [Calditrichaeota bacterium]|nr:DNA repair protein RecO [Calditrichota bacterium]